MIENVGDSVRGEVVASVTDEETRVQTLTVRTDDGELVELRRKLRPDRRTEILLGRHSPALRRLIETGIAVEEEEAKLEAVVGPEGIEQALRVVALEEAAGATRLDALSRVRAAISRGLDLRADFDDSLRAVENLDVPTLDEFEEFGR